MKSLTKEIKKFSVDSWEPTIEETSEEACRSSWFSLRLPHLNIIKNNQGLVSQDVYDRL